MFLPYYTKIAWEFTLIERMNVDKWIINNLNDIINLEIICWRSLSLSRILTVWFVHCTAMQWWWGFLPLVWNPLKQYPIDFRQVWCIPDKLYEFINGTRIHMAPFNIILPWYIIHFWYHIFTENVVLFDFLFAGMRVVDTDEYNSGIIVGDDDNFIVNFRYGNFLHLCRTIRRQKNVLWFAISIVIL